MVAEQDVRAFRQIREAVLLGQRNRTIMELVCVRRNTKSLQAAARGNAGYRRGAGRSCEIRVYHRRPAAAHIRHLVQGRADLLDAVVRLAAWGKAPVEMLSELVADAGRPAIAAAPSPDIPRQNPLRRNSHRAYCSRTDRLLTFISYLHVNLCSHLISCH